MQNRVRLCELMSKKWGMLDTVPQRGPLIDIEIYCLVVYLVDTFKRFAKKREADVPAFSRGAMGW